MNFNSLYENIKMLFKINFKQMQHSSFQHHFFLQAKMIFKILIVINSKEIRSIFIYFRGIRVIMKVNKIDRKNYLRKIILFSTPSVGVSSRKTKCDWWEIFLSWKVKQKSAFESEFSSFWNKTKQMKRTEKEEGI